LPCHAQMPDEYQTRSIACAWVNSEIGGCVYRSHVGTPEGTGSGGQASTWNLRYITDRLATGLRAPGQAGGHSALSSFPLTLISNRVRVRVWRNESTHLHLALKKITVEDASHQLGLAGTKTLTARRGHTEEVPVPLHAASALLERPPFTSLPCPPNAST